MPLLLLMGFVAVNTQPVYAATNSSDPPQAICTILHVQLHGKQPASSTCLKASVHGKTMIPAGIYTSWCGSDDLQLYFNANFGGSEICFSGNGTVNLTDFGLLSCGEFSILGQVFDPCSFTSEDIGASWNDQISSYKPGKWMGDFFWDTNEQGIQYFFGYHANTPWIGHFWNDQISSIAIWGSD